MPATPDGNARTRATLKEKLGEKGYSEFMSSIAAKGGKRQVPKGLAAKRVRDKYELKKDEAGKVRIYCIVCVEPVKNGMLKHYREVHSEIGTSPKEIPREQA